MGYIDDLGARALVAKQHLATASSGVKNAALKRIAELLVEATPEILTQNMLDIDAAVKNDMSVSMQDRLMLSEARIKDIADSIYKLIDETDPIGCVDSGSVRPNGLKITKVRVPLGVIGIIFESRPNVTVDAATLCLKSGNVVILRGGKEAINSNKCLTSIMRRAVEDIGLPADVIQLVEDTSREVAAELMQLSALDVLIPRGGAGLINAVVSQAKVPVIQTGVGNCHVFVDASADLDMAVRITDNAKTQRPSVCNAIESLIVHSSVADAFLPMIASAFEAHKVIIKGDEKTAAILGDSVRPATDDDYATEFLDYIISVKIVDSIDEAIAHISRFGTGHSECIITNDYNNAKRFQNEVDAAAVYVNASTRFTDGGEFGFGAEVGISTQKLHARGPMGLRELTSAKYVIDGNGQIR